ncbi:type VI secretion system contractile sheath domain-containing protein [Anatilimnocola floriformis]|uniref:type VI secretion system contractile sheath domain-containing protein n=1 Tax=Anatilimnocola floriformis TaxID=2948575 RepID=UPI0020C47BBD|nr:type VI secretion system contractile sheath large subunit [Anatilimnocola floriformis]
MGKSWSLGGSRVGMEAADGAEEIDEKLPLKIVVLGDFSGRGSQRNAKARGSGAIRAFAIDRDNFEQVLQHFNVRLDGVPVTPSGELGSVPIDSLDDFHPDALLQRVASLRALRELRGRLSKRETFVAAMEEAKTLLEPPSSPSSSPPTLAFRDEAQAPAATNSNPSEGGSLLDQILDASESGEAPPPRRLNEIERYAQAMMAPYSIPADDPRQDAWLDTADQATAFALQQLLHSRPFRELEARWRSLDWLVRRVDSDVNIKVAVIDLSEQELRNDLNASNLAESALYELFVQRPKLKQEPGWNVIVLDQRLTSSLADVEVLGKLSLIANDCRARLLIGLTDDAVGCVAGDKPFQPAEMQRPSETWLSVRRLPDTKQTSLLWPGFLLRQPYGSKTSPVESLELEELSGVQPANAMLIGNGAYLAAAQLIREHEEESGSDYTGLPCVVLPDGGGKQMVPATGWWLRDTAVEHLQRIGVTPVFALPHAGALRLFPLRSFHITEE